MSAVEEVNSLISNWPNKFRSLYQTSVNTSRYTFRLLRWYLVFLSPLYILPLFQSLIFFLAPIRRVFRSELSYPITYHIDTTSAKLIFTRSKRTKLPICLKLWQRCNLKVRTDKLVTLSIDSMLEGLELNQQFAQGVYLGIAPVKLQENENRIIRGRLITMPKKNDLVLGAEYAIVMIRLVNEWRLDYQLGQSKPCKEVSIEFLAKEVARMHKRLEKSPGIYGTFDGILSKLNLNCELFLKALIELSDGNNNLEKYKWIVEIIARACRAYEESFRRRYQHGHIKRCHGDLKATNLWISPAKTLFFGLKKYPQQLLALDCIDFNPEFCNIDTLSDVAMLAIDIEMNSMNKRYVAENTDYGQGLANYFLDSYLRDYGQDVDSWPLLQYYMTEKAMVCAYVSILYDSLPALGEKYLHIASVHAMQLPLFIDTAVEIPAFVVSQSR